MSEFFLSLSSLVSLSPPVHGFQKQFHSLPAASRRARCVPDFLDEDVMSKLALYYSIGDRVCVCACKNHTRKC